MAEALEALETTHPGSDFFAVGSAGVDGITFGFRLGSTQIWAYYPISAEFQAVGGSLRDLVTGWDEGRITV